MLFLILFILVQLWGIGLIIKIVWFPGGEVEKPKAKRKNEDLSFDDPEWEFIEEYDQHEEPIPLIKLLPKRKNED